MGYAVVFLVMLLSAPAVFGAQYPVDWQLGPSYSSWTTKPLNEGDTLVFTYDGTHTVEVVSQSDFASCNLNNALQTETKSPTTITLKAGTTYFICGTPGHCRGGMKLQVTAKAASAGPATPTTTPATPTTPTGTSAPPPTTPSGSGGSTPTPTAPSPSAGSLLSGGGLSLGLGLGALVALLG